MKKTTTRIDLNALASEVGGTVVTSGVWSSYWDGNDAALDFLGSLHDADDTEENQKQLRKDVTRIITYVNGKTDKHNHVDMLRAGVMWLANNPGIVLRFIPVSAYKAYLKHGIARLRHDARTDKEWIDAWGDKRILFVINSDLDEAAQVLKNKSLKATQPSGSNKTTPENFSATAFDVVFKSGVAYVSYNNQPVFNAKVTKDFDQSEIERRLNAAAKQLDSAKSAF